MKREPIGCGAMIKGASRVGEVRLWDGRTRKPMRAPLSLGLPVTALAFDASGHRFLVATGDPLTGKAGEARAQLLDAPESARRRQRLQSLGGLLHGRPGPTPP